MAEPKVLEKRPKSSQKQVSFVVRLPDAQEVSVTGDFTNWSEDGIALAKGSNGDWQTNLRLSPGEYQYRLRVDGAWCDHCEAQKRVPNPFGSENCVLSI
jgi:1,4-alpha-glucan branching enzyme